MHGSFPPSPPMSTFLFKCAVLLCIAQSFYWHGGSVELYEGQLGNTYSGCHLPRRSQHRSALSCFLRSPGKQNAMAIRQKSKNHAFNHLTAWQSINTTLPTLHVFCEFLVFHHISKLKMTHSPSQGLKILKDFSPPLEVLKSQRGVWAWPTWECVCAMFLSIKIHIRYIYSTYSVHTVIYIYRFTYILKKPLSSFIKPLSSSNMCLHSQTMYACNMHLSENDLPCLLAHHLTCVRQRTALHRCAMSLRLLWSLQLYIFLDIIRDIWYYSWLFHLFHEIIKAKCQHLDLHLAPTVYPNWISRSLVNSALPSNWISSSGIPLDTEILEAVQGEIRLRTTLAAFLSWTDLLLSTSDPCLYGLHWVARK